MAFKDNKCDFSIVLKEIKGIHNMAEKKRKGKGMGDQNYASVLRGLKSKVILKYRNVQEVNSQKWQPFNESQ